MSLSYGHIKKIKEVELVKKIIKMSLVGNRVRGEG